MLRALCITRHAYLSEHVCRLFAAYGLDTTPAVGLERALALSRARTFDLVLCDYDLLAAQPLETLAQDGFPARTPLVAVSLRRPPEEAQWLGSSGIADYVYLPTLDRATALRVLDACQAVATGYSLPSPFASPQERRARSSRVSTTASSPTTDD